MRCPEGVYCCFCKCCITETSIDNVHQFADIQGASDPTNQLQQTANVVPPLPLPLPPQPLITPHGSPQDRSPVIQSMDALSTDLNAKQDCLCPPNPALVLSLPHFVSSESSHHREQDVSSQSSGYPDHDFVDAHSVTSHSSHGSPRERVIARLSWCCPPHPDLPDSPGVSERTYPVDPDLAPHSTQKEESRDSLGDSFNGKIHPDSEPNYSFDSKASMKSSSGILKVKSMIKDPGDGMVSDAADSSDDSTWNAQIKMHRPPRSKLVQIRQTGSWTSFVLEPNVNVVENRNRSNPNNGDLNLGKNEDIDFVDPRSPPNTASSPPLGLTSFAAVSRSRSANSASMRLPKPRSHATTSWKSRSVQSQISQSSLSQSHYSLVYSDCCSSQSSKISETSSPAISTMHQQFVSTREIPSQDKLIAPIDCQGIIELIPFDRLPFRDDFWSELGVSSREQRRQYLVDRCLDRFHDLYDETLDDIRMRYGPSTGLGLGSELESDHDAPSNITRNLVVLNLEKTVLISDIPTPGKMHSINGSYSNSMWTRLSKQNRKDLVLQFIGNTQEIDDEFGGMRNQLVMVRAGLMEVLYSMTARKIGDNTFDVVVYGDGGTNDAFHNAVAIEMYFNFYYRMIRDPDIDVETHRDSMFKFMFIMTYCRDRDGAEIKKSLDALHSVMEDSMTRFDRILIVDSNIQWWDHRLPKKCKYIWNNVLPIKVPKFTIWSKGGSLKDMAAQRKHDEGLKYLHRFLIEIDKQFPFIINQTRGFLHMNWIEFDGDRVRIIKPLEMQRIRSSQKLNAPRSGRNLKRTSLSRSSTYKSVPTRRR